MGLLDDLKQQAEKQQDTPGTPNLAGGTGDFYGEQVKSRMLAAFNFLTELVNQLNTMKLDTRADYPFRPDGKPVTLLQQGYKVYNDHITDPRQITFTCFCGLANPTVFEVAGRGAVMAQSELLDRYHFKYEKREQKDPRQMVIGAKFRLVGPLPIKMVLQVDEGRQVIKLLLTNFAGPGTSQYHLKPEKLDDAFMDHLGKYLLRKEAALFKEEISDDAKAMLRKKLQEEQQQREAELQQAEEARKAEEARRKQNSTTEQLKKAVSQSVTENTEKLKKAMNEQLKRVMHTQVAKGKESLKGMLGKLKKQTQAPQQTPSAQVAPPAQSTPQTIPPASTPLTKPAQPHQQVTAKPVRSAQINTPASGRPPMPEPTAEPVRVSAAPAKRQIPQSNAAEAPTQSLDSPASLKTAAEPAGVTNSKPASPASPAAVQTAPVKKTKPPKVYNAPSNNPFLKPEPPVEPPVDVAAQEAKTPGELALEPLDDAAERAEKTAAEQPEVEATPVADSLSRPDLTPESLEADLARIIERDKQNMPQQTPESNKTTNSFLQTPSTKVAAQTATPPAGTELPRTDLKPGELNTELSDVMPITRQAVSAKDATAPEAKNSTQNPVLELDEPEELDIDFSSEEKS